MNPIRTAKPKGDATPSALYQNRKLKNTGATPNMGSATSSDKF